METKKSRIISVLAAASLFACGWFARELTFVRLRTGETKGTALRTVATEKVAKRPLNPCERYVGHVEPIQEVDILPQIDGYLEKVNFKEGDLVKTGDVLFEIDDERYVAADQMARAGLAQAQARVAESEASVDKALRYWKRLTSTDERGITQTEKDAAETGLAAEKAALAKAKAAVKEAQAQIASSAFNLKHTTIRAPFAGRIGKTFAHVGDYVAPSKGAMAHLVQVDPIRVDFPMTDRAYLALGRQAEKRGMSPSDLLRLRLRLADGSVYPTDGRWVFADNEMSAETATMSIRAEFGNPAGELLPKAYVEVLADEKAPSAVLAMPKTALAHGAVANGLWILKDDGTVTLREVKLGRSDGALVELTDGIAEGETVVVQGVSKLSEGVKVTVVPAVDLGEKGSARK